MSDESQRVLVRSIEDLEKFCETLASMIQRQPRTLLLLSGPMGVGKTKLTELLVTRLGGAPGQVSSPTFALHHQYRSPGFEIHHFDLFRIESDSDLESTGFWDIFAVSRGVVVIEWPGKWRAHLPKDWPTVNIEIRLVESGDESHREITYQSLAI
jgi:tRNA threonylcarbamoyladenosine biosynthesis protein TsaE